MASPLGDLEITLCDDALADIRYLHSRLRGRKGPAVQRSRSARRTARDVEYQLRRYFDDPYWRFDLKLMPCGTPYQQRVWKYLARIPAGRPMTYGEVAARLGSGPRAVGGACRSNPVPIVIPCHRVIAASAVGGYCGNMRGRMLHAKRWLLRHEHSHKEE